MTKWKAKLGWTPKPGTKSAQILALINKGMDVKQVREMLNLQNSDMYYFVKKQMARAKGAPMAKRKTMANKPTFDSRWIVECIVHTPSGPFRVFALEGDFVEAYSRAMTAARNSQSPG